MKHIAVVGFQNTQQFRDWAYNRLNGAKKREVGYDWAVNFDENIWYYCILCVADIRGRVFDGIIECDTLRLELRLGLKNEEE